MSMMTNIGASYLPIMGCSPLWYVGSRTADRGTQPEGASTHSVSRRNTFGPAHAERLWQRGATGELRMMAGWNITDAWHGVHRPPPSRGLTGELSRLTSRQGAANVALQGA